MRGKCTLNATTSKINEHAMNYNEITKVCRTCLEELTDSEFLSINDVTNNVQDELIACLPELDLSLVPDASMCVFCASALHAAFCFKRKCLQTEEKIRNHLQDAASLDLVEIKQESELDEKFDIVPGVGLGMEIIYIKDDESTTTENGANAAGSNSIAQEEVVTSFLDVQIEKKRSFNKLTAAIGMSKLKKMNGKTHSIQKNIRSAANKSYHSNSISIKPLKRIGVKIKNRQRIYHCRFCDFETSYKHLHATHLETHSDLKPYACLKCNYRTMYKQCLQNHLSQCNSSTPNEIVKLTGTRRTGLKGAKSFKCAQCDFETLHKQLLFQHKQVHAEKNVLKCTKCTYEVSNLSTFKRHLANHKKGSFKCNQCDYKCGELLDLKLHAATHKKKLHKCTICDYSTAYNTSYANHMLTHTGEKRYACKLCDYKAIQKVNLLKHVKQHSNRKPFKCTECSYGLGNKTQLLRHMKLQHGKKR